jgi:hypothetical protein
MKAGVRVNGASRLWIRIKSACPAGPPPIIAEISLSPGESTQINLGYQSKTVPSQNGTLQIRTTRRPMVSGPPLFSIALTTRKATPYALNEPGNFETDPSKNALSLRTSGSQPISSASKNLAQATSPESDPATGTPVANTILPKDAVPGARALGEISSKVLGNIGTAFMPWLEGNEISVSDITWHSVKLTFQPPPEITPEQIVIRTRFIELTPNLELRTVWKPHPSIHAKLNKLGLMEVHVHSLPSNSSVGLLVSGPRLKNNLSLIYKQLDINTLARPHWLSYQRPWIWVLIALVLPLAYLKSRSFRLRFR